MRNQLASVELRVLADELKQLESSRVSQVYELEAAGVKPGKALVFQLSKSEGKKYLICLVPSAVFFSRAKPATSEKQGGFCSMLRQHLDNARLTSISQLGSERIVELIFSSGKEQPRLIIELFSKGNVILADEKGVILSAAEHQAWKDRTIRPGFTYQQPPATADFAAMSGEQFSKALLSSEKDSVVKALAVDLGLSGSYAEELCLTAAVEKAKKPAQLSPAELTILFSSLQQLLSRKPSPIAVLDGSSSVVEVFPFPTVSAAAAKTKPFSSFNEAVEALSLRQFESSFSASREFPSLRRIKELEIAIGQQKAMMVEMEKVVNEATAAAEAVYTHYQDVRRILDDYNTLRKTFTPEQLREYFKSNKKVVSIDEKTGTIMLEIEDGSGGNQ